jgi:hypothetical protein
MAPAIPEQSGDAEQERGVQDQADDQPREPQKDSEINHAALRSLSGAGS